MKRGRKANPETYANPNCKDRREYFREYQRKRKQRLLELKATQTDQQDTDVVLSTPQPTEKIRDAMIAALSDRGPETLRRVCNRLIALANKGQIGAIRELFDRLEGKATQSLEVKQRSDSLALDALRSMPPEVAAQQIDAAMRQLEMLRKSITSEVTAVASEVRQLPAATPQDVVFLDDDNQNQNITDLESTNFL